jgi:chemotaxis protein MotC
LRLRAFFAAIFLLALGHQPASAQADRLVDVVWELVEAQDSAVDGGASNQAKILAQIDQQISSLSAEDWKQLRNYRAAVIYVLAGGSSKRLRGLLLDHTIEEKDPPLLTASLAFADGDRDNATKLMAQIDVKSYPPILAGYLALVRGGLLMGSDKKEASNFLSFARLMMPGSQVEEAALRRELTILDPVRDTKRFLLLARRYQSRYANSPFAARYWQSLSANLLKVAAKVDAERFSPFEDLYKAAPHAVSFEFHAALARASIRSSHLETLRAQAQAAAAASDTPQNKERMKLYLAAVHIMEGETGGDELKNIARSSLSKEEIAILNALKDVAAKLDDGGDPAAELATSDRQDGDPDPPIVQGLRQSLADSEKLLQRAGQ